MTKEWIDLAIENWARWGRQSMRWHRCRAGSFEGCFRSRQPWDAPPLMGLVRVNVAAARAVEDAWKTLPFVPKVVLKRWFVMRDPMWEICRSLRKKGYPVETRYWGLEIDRAKLLLGQALATGKYIQYSQLTANEARTEAHVGGFAASAA